MPVLNVRVPADAFDDEQRTAIVRDLSDAIAIAEQIPDIPEKRSRIIVIWEEVPAGRIYADGLDVSALAIPVFCDLQPPAEALTQEAAQPFATAVEAAFQDHASGDRPVMTSLIIDDVTDGRWGISGHINHLADFARDAGYEHLQHLVR